jgi:hypothetical protein
MCRERQLQRETAPSDKHEAPPILGNPVVGHLHHFVSSVIARALQAVKELVKYQATTSK